MLLPLLGRWSDQECQTLTHHTVIVVYRLYCSNWNQGMQKCQPRSHHIWWVFHGCAKCPWLRLQDDPTVWCISYTGNQQGGWHWRWRIEHHKWKMNAPWQWWTSTSYWWSWLGDHGTYCWNSGTSNGFTPQLLMYAAWMQGLVAEWVTSAHSSEIDT